MREEKKKKKKIFSLVDRIPFLLAKKKRRESQSNRKRSKRKRRERSECLASETNDRQMNWNLSVDICNDFSFYIMTIS